MTWFVKESNLLNFLGSLSQDPKLLEQYKENPEAVMDDAGLSDDEKAVLMSDQQEDMMAAFFDRLDQV